VTIPLQALVGSVEMGEKRRCFVMVEGHAEMREITLGKNNETVAEVKEGLKEGDVVVLNPAMLLSEREKAAYGLQSAPSEQGGQGAQGGKGDWKGKGKGGKGDWKGKGKGGPGGGMQGGPGGTPGSPGGTQGTPGGGMQGSRGGFGGPRSQGAKTGGNVPASP
jgi:hypothetical protein